MKDKRSGVRRAGDFLAGKGFYVVLFVCVAVIGVSAWILLFTGGEPDTVEADAIGTEPDMMEYIPEVFGNVWEYDEDVPVNNLETSPTPSAIAPEVSETPPPRVPSTVAPETPSEAPKSEDNAQQNNQSKTLADLTYAWPVAGDVARSFAVDGLIYSRTMADWRTHPGIDITAAIGTKVQAIADGTVIDVFTDDLMGTTVIIDHGYNLRSIYSNLAGTPVVEAGDRVTLGAVIGAVGDTAIGEIGEVAHLHLEMTLDGDAVDPVAYLPKR